jgi:tight adherence protein B
MTDTTKFLILLAGAVMAGGWAMARLVFILTQWERRRLWQRLNESIDERMAAAGNNAPSIRKAAGEAGSAAIEQWRRNLQQADPQLTVARFLVLVASLAFLAGAVVFYFTRSPLIGALAAMLGGYVPFLRTASLRTHRMRLITDQLVEAMEFLSRVLRAGHSLSTGIQMMGEEMPEPIASEFRRCYAQHSLGRPLEEAMTEMALRVDSTHFSFFVTSVLIQRQTGGGLAEVLENIAGIVRNRIRLQQHVKAITAEGRLTGYLLSAFPPGLFLIISMLNKEYAGTLLRTEAGQISMVLGLILQIVALVMIRRIVTVKT